MLVCVSLLLLSAFFRDYQYALVALAAICYLLRVIIGGGESSRLESPRLADQDRHPPKSSATETPDVRVQTAMPADLSPPLPPPRLAAQASGSSAADDPIRVDGMPLMNSAADFKIPSCPKQFGIAKWIPKGESVEIAGTKISGGLIYVGTSLRTSAGGNAPTLINPLKAVAAQGDCRRIEIDFWPSYCDISKSARRAYLNWLASGACDANAYIGYVYLYFYGLERRVVVDANGDAAAIADFPVIAAELRRLLGIYGRKHPSLKSHVSALLNYVSWSGDLRLYARAIPNLEKSDHLPFYIRLALGQAALDKAPVSAALALAWLKLDPNYFPRTAAVRCSAHFDALFELRYRDKFDAGMVIPKNRTKLKLVYRPASPGFDYSKEIKLTFGEVPDVSILTWPIAAIRAIAEATTNELDAYSRFVGRNPEADNSLEAVLILPHCILPLSWRQIFAQLKSDVALGPVLMSFNAFLARLGVKTILSKERTLALARLLGRLNIGFEPDILGNAKLPKLNAQVVLFCMLEADDPPRTASAYQTAILTLQLASAVACAKGSFGVVEFDHLCNQVRSWVQLAPSQQQRLLAHLHLLRVMPVSLGALKARIDLLDDASKQSIALFMAILVQADGIVSLAKVKMLQKIYKALRIDAKRVFSDLHTAPTYQVSQIATPNDSAQLTGFKLDPARIAALQADTARVSRLLSSIFCDSVPEHTAEQINASLLLNEIEFEPEKEVPENTQAEHFASSSLMGLDEAHAALARMLLTRSQWTREELQDMAADLELMLDGALERINEASFDSHDLPFTEGEDMIDINHEIREKIVA